MKYRKKPVVIDAVLFEDTPACGDALAELEKGATCQMFVVGGSGLDDETGKPYPTVIEVATLEGVMTAQLGDYIIRGVKGELYPCRGDIFAATYEPAE